eukprot:TRINITY_DN23024_c0_g1_i1.p1 TRINITY_DN23024_c0_g1~~TRINITY_DN23024_c0_g1_i1.p1  ORF type:complete len:287 (+),score=15.33 TRINITY_DN23024_c0_g1_i1:22-861(+)
MRGDTCTTLAAFNGHLDVVKWLIEEAGANAQEADTTGCTTLLGATFNGHLPVVSWLLNSGHASLAERNHYGQSALLTSVAGGSLPLVQWLVEAGADMHVVDQDGESVLETAARRGQKEILLWLLEQHQLKPVGSLAARCLHRGSGIAHLVTCHYLLQEGWDSAFNLEPHIANLPKIMDHIARLNGSTAQKQHDKRVVCWEPPTIEIPANMNILAMLHKWSISNHRFFPRYFRLVVGCSLWSQRQLQSTSQATWLPVELVLSTVVFLPCDTLLEEHFHTV